jgi:CRP-like cAMP-binding protein
MMDTYEGSNGRTLNDILRRERGGVEAAFGSRHSADAAGRVTLCPKVVEAISVNALLSNRLLSALPQGDFERLLPHLEPVNLSAGEDLYRFEGGVDFAYFPETAVVTHLYIMADGDTTESALVGREGFAGLSALFNARQPCYWTRVLVAGSALRIRIDVLKEEFGRGGALQPALLAYAGARMAQLSQRAVCGGSHTVRERLCCWLLMLHDRVGEDRLPLTHELIATHLGARRAGVTEIAIGLREAGCIGYARGLVRILDRARLEAAACECYQSLGRPAARAV